MNPKIRFAKQSDVTEMLEIYAPFILETTVSFEIQAPSEKEFWGRVKKVLAKSPWLVCEIDGKIVGYAYAGDHRERAAYQWNRELSAYISDKYHRRGIASAMYHSLVEIIKMQGYQNALSGITLPNEKSVAFHENFGFQQVGIYHKVGHKFGKWHSVGWWEMPLTDMIGQPPKIVHFKNLEIEHILKKHGEQIR